MTPDLLAGRVHSRPRALQARFPDDAVTIVLSTDGAHTACGAGGDHAQPDPQDLDAAIAAQRTVLAARIETYVVGIATTDPTYCDALRQIAATGDGGEPTLISPGSATSVIASKLQSRWAAAGRETGCSPSPR